MSIEELIDRYLQGTLTTSERKLLQEYLGNKDLSGLNDKMKRDWKEDAADNRDVPEELSREILQHVKSKIQQTKIISIKKSKRKFQWIAVAAALLLLLGLGTVLEVVAWPQKTRVVTGFGEWKSIQLPDGSVGELNANSELIYTNNWKNGVDRKVWLKGEAFFNVKKENDGAKFLVITEDLTVEVLGTSFNVNSRGQETKVYLQEGKIKLNLAEQDTYMDPGDYVVYSSVDRAIIERKKAPAELHTSWKDGTLMLKDETVANIIKKIEEIYGFTVKITDKELLSQKKTISVPINEVEVAITLLEDLLGLRIEPKDTTSTDNQLINWNNN